MNEKLKINFIVPEFSRTGGMRVITLFARELIKKGHEVIMTNPGIPFNSYMGLIKPYFIKYRIRKSANYFLGRKSGSDDFFETTAKKVTVPLINDFFVQDADAVIATAWPSAFAVSKLSVKKGKKFYLIQDYETWNSNTIKVDESYLLPLTKISVSGYLHGLLKEKFNTDSEKVLVSPDYEIFDNGNKIFNNPPKILFMDHLLQNKNVEGAIDTAVKLKIKYPYLIFNCFGVDKFHDIPDFIKFHKNPDDNRIKNLYCESDIFIFPSKYEGFGLPPAEAMACKCAVVGNSVAALPEFAENDVSAILVKPDDDGNLLKGVEKLITNPELLKHISFGGYEAVKRNLSWEKSGELFETILYS
jgi:glycosyltransferase involved in cell wall biosynthesis